MKDDVKRPLYADFKKHEWGWLTDDRPLHSRERLYEFADRPLLMFLYSSLCAAFLFMSYYLPRPGNTVYGIILFLVYIIFAVICLAFYHRRFVYRFARFHVQWEDWQYPGAACEGCDERGEFLPTRENRAAKLRSRCAFLALFAAAAAIAALVYIFVWGMAEQRVKSSPLLAEFARIAEKQGDAIVDVDSDGVEVWSRDGETPMEIVREDEAELERIFEELQWNYAEDVYWMDGEVHVFMHGGLESKSIDAYFGRQ